MTHTFRATYDGECLHPAEPLPVPPNTEIVLSYEAPVERKPGPARSFLDVARSSQIEGPSDWSERVDHYLYGGMVDDEE
ncbi:MAG TPA: hypothetical protein VF541_12860 [Longimicrobium sp.]|jgi:hypothetical protein